MYICCGADYGSSSCEFGVVGASQLALLREGAVSVRVLWRVVVYVVTEVAVHALTIQTPNLRRNV